jgi:hypothetical protein
MHTGPEAWLADKGLREVPSEGPIAVGDVPGTEEVVEVEAGPAVSGAFGNEAPLTGRDGSVENGVVVSTGPATDDVSIAADGDCDPAAVACSRCCISTALPLAGPPCVVWRGSLA